MKNNEFKLHLAIKEHIEKCFLGTKNPNLKFWHVANENRDATQGFWNKKLGILPGVLDFQFGWPVSKAGILEIKIKGNRLTSNQNRFISWAHLIGWHTGVAYTVREAHEILKSWGLNPNYETTQEPDYSTKQEKFQSAHEMYAPTVED